MTSSQESSEEMADTLLPTEEELIEFHQRLVYAAAPRRERVRGDIIGETDAIEISMLGFLEGCYVPFTARASHRLEPDISDEDATLYACLMGETVGSSVVVMTLTSATHPEPSLRAVPLQLVVTIDAAWEVMLTPENEAMPSPLLGEFDSEDDAMDWLIAEWQQKKQLIEDAEREEQARAEAEELLLKAHPWTAGDDALEKLIDLGLREIFEASEGSLLDRAECSEGDRRRAENAWLTAPGLRAQLARQIRLLVAEREAQAQERSGSWK